MVCLFCLRVTIDGIPISGDTEQAKNVRDIICKYFWFNVSKSKKNLALIQFDGKFFYVAEKYNWFDGKLCVFRLLDKS